MTIYHAPNTGEAAEKAWKLLDKKKFSAWLEKQGPFSSFSKGHTRECPIAVYLSTEMNENQEEALIKPEVGNDYVFLNYTLPSSERAVDEVTLPQWASDLIHLVDKYRKSRVSARTVRRFLQSIEIE